jgi:hypothetical protein
MVTQYPHKITINVMPLLAAQDGDGNWVSAAPIPTEMPCRAEPNAKGSFIIGPDGTQVYFAWMIYMPTPASDIALGTKVTILDENDNQKGGGEVKRYNRGQLNSMIWL